jgi:hypothetical protein
MVGTRTFVWIGFRWMVPWLQAQQLNGPPSQQPILPASALTLVRNVCSLSYATLGLFG